MSLVDELDSKITQGNGKVIFLAQLDEIKTALNKGYPRIIIWKHLNESGKMPVSYRSFTIYVQQYITTKEEQTKNFTPDESGESSPDTPIPKAENTVFDVLKLPEVL